MITTIPDRERTLQAEVDRLTAELARLRAVEPVAWMDDFGNAFPLAANKGAGSWMDEHKRHWKPLYRAAPPAQPAEPVQLTETEIFKAYTTATGKVLPNKWGVREELVAITRIVERAHGIEAAPKATK